MTADASDGGVWPNTSRPAPTCRAHLCFSLVGMLACLLPAVRSPAGLDP